MAERIWTVLGVRL